MSKSACVVPWSTLTLGPDGRAVLCCEAPVVLEVGGRSGSIYRDTLAELWNADQLVAVRGAMARGERPGACDACWGREAAGDVSRRLIVNQAYRQLGGSLPIDGLAQQGADAGHRLTRPPDWFILELGNVCNLRCRSCSGLYSSRIAADAVASSWPATGAPATPPWGGPADGPPPRSSPLRLAPESGAAWFEDIDGMADMIASGAGEPAFLSLIGGEPFLIDAVWRLLGALVARGAASHLYAFLVTNGQQRRAELADLAPHFRGFCTPVSIDGHGKLYEYLRHGASWRRLVDNLDWLQGLPAVRLIATPTLSNVNALDLVPLLRFFDERELTMSYNVLHWPARLRPATLPPTVRRIAAARLRFYLDQECRTANRDVVAGLCGVLEDAPEDFDAELFAEFMAFTNDLDASRGESLAEAAPELAALLRGAGVKWRRERRPVSTDSVAPAVAAHEDVLRRVNRTVAAGDKLYAGFEAAGQGAYFRSAVGQVATIDEQMRLHGHPGLRSCRAIADFACHFGRVTRVLRAALPHAAIYACDIDPLAARFCVEALGAAAAVVTGWQPDEDRLPGGVGAVICVSLLTHTDLEHWRRVLHAWKDMLQPGGVAAFTYLDAGRVERWLAGQMEHYGSYSPERRATAKRELAEQGFGFAAIAAAYGEGGRYGVAFASPEVVRREVAAAGLELLAMPATATAIFDQELVLARRPAASAKGAADAATPDGGGSRAAGAFAARPKAARQSTVTQTAPAPPQHDVQLVALYDPRGYAPADTREGDPAKSAWARLAGTHPPVPLPTDLGFGDPRVAEVRQAQAALAREHGIDAFCLVSPWGAQGPRWDAAWRAWVASGRPEFAFCLMLDVEEGEVLGGRAAAEALAAIGPALRDGRYLRVSGRPLLAVRDVSRLADVQAVAAGWRTSAAAQGVGEIHLCAAEPVGAERPADIGFDSFLEAPPAGEPNLEAMVAGSLGRAWPAHQLFRKVECARGYGDGGGGRAGELYELWLRSAIDATRQNGGGLVFVDAWNDWPAGRYLEPDDRDGRAALLATRRAARGPASGLVLLRQLRDALVESARDEHAAPRIDSILGELEQVLALHEGARDRLLATVEAALGRNPSGPSGSIENASCVPVPSRQLPPSRGGFSLDRVGAVGGDEIHRRREPIPVRGDEVSLAGWAHLRDCPPERVQLFLALESESGSSDRVFPVAERVERQDVAAALRGTPLRCGFDTTVNLFRLPPGVYRVAIVQRTSCAAWRDLTPVAIARQ